MKNGDDESQPPGRHWESIDNAELAIENTRRGNKICQRQDYGRMGRTERKPESIDSAVGGDLEKQNGGGGHQVLEPGQDWTALPETIDRPTGGFYCVPSGITGMPLRYFTPDPLPDLLARARLRKYSTSDQSIYLALSLARAASHRKGRFDQDQCARYLNILFDRDSIKGLPCLIRLGNAISPINRGLRRELSFSGGTTPSTATHIFTPDPQIPNLMDGYNILFQSDADLGDPVVTAAIAGFFSVHLHPFGDGNGRWSRLLAALAGVKASTPLSGMISATFLGTCVNELTGNVWPMTRSVGLRSYVGLALQFDKNLRTELAASGIAEAVEQITTCLRAGSTNRREAHYITCQLLTASPVAVSDMRLRFGISARALAGKLQTLSSVSNNAITVNEAEVSASGLAAQIDQAVLSAKAATFQS